MYSFSLCVCCPYEVNEQVASFALCPCAVCFTTCKSFPKINLLQCFYAFNIMVCAWDSFVFKILREL